MAVRRNYRERIVVILSPGETRKHAPLHLGGAQAVCEVRSKNGPWTDLEKDTMPLTDKLGDCVREAHGGAHIAPPIFGVEHFGFNYVARYRRHQPHLRRARSKTAKIRQEVLAEAVHCSRVEGEIQIKRAAPDVTVLQLGFQALDFLDGTRNRHRAGSVDRSDLGRTVQFGENVE